MEMLKGEEGDKNLTPEEHRLKTTNYWILGLFSFALVYSTIMFFVLSDKTSKNTQLINRNQQTIALITDPSQSGTNNIVVLPKMERKADYNIGDIVFIDYFYMRGVVIDKSTSFGNVEYYTIMYRDVNKTLQTIRLKKDFLLFPIDESIMKPNP